MRTHEFDGHPIREFAAWDGRVFYSTQDVCKSVGLTKYRDKQAKLGNDMRATLRAVTGRQAGRLVCLTTEAGVLMIIMRVRGEGSEQVQALRDMLASGAKISIGGEQDDMPSIAQPAIAMPNDAVAMREDEEWKACEAIFESAEWKAAEADHDAIISGSTGFTLPAFHGMMCLPREDAKEWKVAEADRGATGMAPKPKPTHEAVLLDVVGELTERGELERANAVKLALGELTARRKPARAKPAAELDVRDPRVLAAVALQLAEFVQELSDSHRDLGTRVVQLESEVQRGREKPAPAGSKALRAANPRALPMSVRTPEQPGRPSRPKLPTGDIGFRPLAKVLNVNERSFAQWLLENRILYRLEGRLTPTSRASERGWAYTTTIEIVDPETGSSRVVPRTLFTPKGVEYMLRLQDVRIVS